MARYVFLILCLCLTPFAWAQEDDPEQTREEVRIGRSASRLFERQERIRATGAEVERLKAILKKLGKVSGRPLPYSVKIVESEEINAITFPGGLIYFYRGLLDQGLDQQMLACVMAHEVAHGCRSHGYRRLLQMEALGTITGSDFVSGMTRTLLISGVGRTYEYQADRVGMQLAAKAGYDPRAMLRVMQLFQRLGDDRPGLMTGMVATHPPAKERIKRIQAELKSMGR